jgi:hypothetical protein
MVDDNPTVLSHQTIREIARVSIGGKPVTVRAVLSDPLDVDLPALGKLAVSLYVPEASPASSSTPRNRSRPKTSSPRSSRSSRAHEHGIQVIGGTLLPFGASEESPGYRTPEAQATRPIPRGCCPPMTAATISTPTNAGYRAMAETVDPKLFE